MTDYIVAGVGLVLLGFAAGVNYMLWMGGRDNRRD